MKKGFTLAIFLIVVFLIHLIINLFRVDGIAWYESLARPAWAPTPVGLIRIWAAMFIFKTVAGALLWLAPKGRRRKLCIELWIGVIALDTLWHFTFFRYESLVLTIGTFIALICAASALIYYALKVDKAASFLLVPYFFWLVYASIVLISMIKLNYSGIV